ncbi:hypothetical protein ACER0C_003287 [Sarotherodon galilaeus]
MAAECLQCGQLRLQYTQLTSPLLLLSGVCVLLLSAPTVSAVTGFNWFHDVNVIWKCVQQVFSGSSSVSLSCVDDGQTADGWTVKRTRGGPTEDCGAAAASSFGQFSSSSCILSSLTQSDSAAYWCETSSGQSDQINITVTVKGVILLIPALPVWTGSDVTLECSNGKTAAAYFFIKGIQKADEGFYSCSTNEDGKSPESFLRVRGGRGADLWSCGGDGCLRRSVCLYFSGLFLLTAAGVCVLLLSALTVSTDSQHAPGVEVFERAESVLLPCQVPADVSRSATAAVWDRDELKVPTVHVRLQSGVDLKDQNHRYFSRTSMRVDALQTGDLSLTLRNPTVSDSDNYTCTTRRAGDDLKKIHVQLKVKAPPLSSESVLRLFCHLVVFCPYCISTGLLLSISWSRKTQNKPVVSMEMSQRDGRGQGLAEDGDDVTADVTTEHAF